MQRVFILLKKKLFCSLKCRYDFGEVAEWSNAAVSKTVIPAMVSRVRISPSPLLSKVDQ